MIPLAKLLLKETVKNIAASVDDFEKLLTDMKNVLEDIDSNRNALFDFFANQQESLDGKSGEVIH